MDDSMLWGTLWVFFLLAHRSLGAAMDVFFSHWVVILYA
jgi:hypothetical protein